MVSVEVYVLCMRVCVCVCVRRSEGLHQKVGHLSWKNAGCCLNKPSQALQSAVHRCMIAVQSCSMSRALLPTLVSSGTGLEAGTKNDGGPCFDRMGLSDRTGSSNAPRLSETFCMQECMFMQL